MEKKNLSPVEKGRVTKLSKKSVEDLVNIILRKDDVEKYLRNTLSNVTDECNDIKNRYEEVVNKFCEFKANTTAESRAAASSINIFKTKLDTSDKRNQQLKEAYEKCEAKYSELYAKYNELLNAHSTIRTRYIAYAIGIAIISFVFGGLIM